MRPRENHRRPKGYERGFGKRLNHMVPDKYKRVRRTIVAGVLLTIAGIMFLMFVFLESMEENVRKENEYHLSEIAQQVTGKLNSKLEQNWSLLYNMDYNLGFFPQMTDQQIQEYGQQIVREWKFGHLYLVDELGNCIDEYGEQSRLISRDNALMLLKERKKVSFLRRDVNGNSTLFFAIPIESKQCGSVTVSALALEYHIENILDILTISAFDKKGICYVIDQSGTRLFNTQTENALENYNILDYLEKVSDSGKESADEIREAVKNRSTGVTIYTKDRKKEYLCYNPLDDTGWTILLFVGGDTIGENMNRFSKNVFSACAFIVVLLIFICGIIFVRMNQVANRKRDEDVYNRERMLNLLIDRGNEIYMMYNVTEDRLEYVSPNLRRVMGWSRQDAEKLFVEEDYIEETDIHEMKEEFFKWNRQGEFVGSIHKYQNPDTGVVRFMRLQVNQVELSTEEVWIANLSDMTKEQEQRENLEQALLAANSANIAKSNFLSNMSHDIRTPMNAILGMTALAKQYAADPQRVLNYMEKISYSSKHLLSLIDEVLDMSRIESGKMLLENKPFSLSDMLDGIVSMFQTQLKEKKLFFSLEESNVEQNYIVGDELRLSRILVNILSNAIKYTPEQGEIKLTVTELDQSNEGNGRYQFVVKDNGRGMSKEFLETIFTPFSRMEETETSRTQGTGLGMAITKNLLDLMGGSIEVESTLGKGSTFTVQVELELAEPVQGHKDEEGQHTTLKHQFEFAGRRVLIVEDNEINEEILKELLKLVGAETESARNGQEAVAMFQNSADGEYDFILMDIQMPILNGYEATARIRQMDRTDAKQVPIVALTANAFSEDRNRALRAGMNAHVAKPIDMDALGEVLEQIFSNRQSVYNEIIKPAIINN